jgi:glycosyltransferase involved in cell wall biosynthesis
MEKRHNKKILIVANSRAMLVSRLPLAWAAREAGYEVHAASSEAIDDLSVLRGIPLHVFSLSRKGMNPLMELKSLHSLYKLFKRVRPDLVHNLTIKPMIYGSIAARKAGVPAVVNAVTGMGYVFINDSPASSILRSLIMGLYRYAFRLSNHRMLFQNHDDRTFFTRHGFVTEEQCALIKGCGVNCEKFGLSAEKEDMPVVTMASRMLWDKGVGEFVEAAEKLQRDGVQARFVLVGDVDPGNPASLSSDKLREWTASGCIEWWGGRDDMPEILKQSSVVCLPSYREGLPRVLAEACASGRAVVAADVPGCREVVSHGENGYLVPARDSRSLADALQTLIADRSLRDRMGMNGRRMAEGDLSQEAVIARTLEVYNKLLHTNDHSGVR